eukprot:5683373-Prymnesium_polylepis.1
MHVSQPRERLCAPVHHALLSRAAAHAPAITVQGLAGLVAVHQSSPPPAALEHRELCAAEVLRTWSVSPQREPGPACDAVTEATELSVSAAASDSASVTFSTRINWSNAHLGLLLLTRVERTLRQSLFLGRSCRTD